MTAQWWAERHRTSISLPLSNNLDIKPQNLILKIQLHPFLGENLRSSLIPPAYPLPLIGRVSLVSGACTQFLSMVIFSSVGQFSEDSSFPTFLLSLIIWLTFFFRLLLLGWLCSEIQLYSWVHLLRLPDPAPAKPAFFSSLRNAWIIESLPRGLASASLLWYCEKVPCWRGSIERGIRGPFLLSCVVLDLLPHGKVNEAREIWPQVPVFNMHGGELLVSLVWNPHSTVCGPSFTLQAAAWAVWIFLIQKVTVSFCRTLPLQSCGKMAFAAPFLEVSASYDLLAIFAFRWSQRWHGWSI